MSTHRATTAPQRYSLPPIPRPTHRPGDIEYMEDPSDGLGPDYGAQDAPQDDMASGIVEMRDRFHESMYASPGRASTPRRLRARHDQKDYTHYIVLVRGTAPVRVLSGWSYAEDAKEALEDAGPVAAGHALKVYTRKWLESHGLDPRENASWEGPHARATHRSQEATERFQAVIPPTAPRKPASTVGKVVCAPAKVGPRGGSTTIQSLLFDKAQFTKREAKEWALAHDFVVAKPPEEQANYWRIRQVDPCAFKSFRTIPLRDGVLGTVGLAKAAPRSPKASPKASPRSPKRPGASSASGVVVPARKK